MNDFDTYVKSQLEKPKPEWLDGNGNSPREVITRGRIGQLLWEFKNLIPSLKRDLVYNWEGVDTPISYFLQVFILPFILPLLPFMRAWYSYRKALNVYKKGYEEYIRRVKDE